MHGIPFFDEFYRPMYPQAERWCERPHARSGEVGVTPAWRIVLPADPAEPIRMAAQDLQQFLADAGLHLDIAADAPPASPAVRLVLGQGLDGAPESFRIRIHRNGVEVEGADASGIMYGVFHLEDLWRRRRAPALRPGRVARKPALRTRILRSPMSFFHRQELQTVLDAYPETYLQRLAHHGFNGIWLRGRLHEMARVGVFPEFGERADEIQVSLRELVGRCSRYGVRVFLYFNEPLAMPRQSSFWDRHPHLRGQPCASEDTVALCTSTPEVQEFLRTGMESLFAGVPGLAGVILITASEFHTHCFSHLSTRNRTREQWGAQMACPRCRERTPQEVIGEVVACIRQGATAANPQAEIIAWNWSWTLYEDDPQEGVIRSLPPGVAVMGDFERGGKRVTDGFSHVVDEYSLTYAGPSERFLGTATAARSAGRPLYAKLQIGVTHEIATVPYFPVYFRMAEKFANLRREGTLGAMCCWNFGNLPSPNTELANAYFWTPQPRRAGDYLRGVAERDFGPAAAAAVVQAWRWFSKAAYNYPHNIPLLYWGPQHFGPAFPLFFHKVDRHMPIPWLLPAEVAYETSFSWMAFVDFGDQIANYLGPFSAEKLVSCIDALLADWVNGHAILTRALQRSPKRFRANATRELTVAGAVMSQFTTLRHVTEFTSRRDRYWASEDPTEKREILGRLLEIAGAEVENARFCKGLALRNPQLGFHGEAMGFDYTPAKIDAKIAIVRQARREMRKALRELDPKPSRRTPARPGSRGQ